MKRAPSHLKKETRRWVNSVLQDFELEPHHVRLLILAAEAWDRCQEAREKISAEGAVYTNRFGEPKAHPSVAIERDSRVAFARLLRELCLDIEEPKAPGRPPGLY